MQARIEAMLASLDAALDGMVRAREAEGRRLEAIVREQLATIERLVAVVGGLARAHARGHPPAAQGAGRPAAGDGRQSR